MLNIAITIKPTKAIIEPRSMMIVSGDSIIPAPKTNKQKPAIISAIQKITNMIKQPFCLFYQDG